MSQERGESGVRNYFEILIKNILGKWLNDEKRVQNKWDTSAKMSTENFDQEKEN